MSLDDFNVDDEEVDSPVGGVPKEFSQRIDTMEKMLGTMYDQFTNFTSSQSEAQQIKQFDEMLSNMHSKHGEFDDDWVSLQIEKGMEPEDAVKAFQKNIVEKYGSPRKPAPNLLSANGAVKQDQVVPSNLSPEDRKKWALQALLANQD